MTIFFEVSATGTDIGRKLAFEPEEAVYAIKELADRVGKDFAGEAAEYLQWDAAACAKIATFLRALTDAFEAQAIE